MDERQIEETGSRLAYRAYMYRIFHIAFGAEPNTESFELLTNDTTRDAVGFFEHAGDSTDVLVDLSSSEGAQSIPAKDALAGLEKTLETLRSKASDAEYLDSLRTEFTRLFLVPGPSQVYLWESPYISNENMLFQENTLDVRSRYRQYGFQAKEFGHFPEDHLAMMLDFLAHLSTRAFDAFADGRDEEYAGIVRSQREFVAQHIEPWLPTFCEGLAEKDRLGVFREFAYALNAFVQMDLHFMGE